MAKYDANKFKVAEPPKPPAPSVAAIRDRFAKKVPSACELHTFDLKDGGPPVELEAVGITAGERWRIQSECFRDESGPDGTVRSMPIPRLFWPHVIAATYRDPATKEKVWSPDDVDLIAAMDPSVVDALAVPALRLAGWSKEAREEMAGNSAAAGADSSSTSAAS